MNKGIILKLNFNDIRFNFRALLNIFLLFGASYSQESPVCLSINTVPPKTGQGFTSVYIRPNIADSEQSLNDHSIYNLQKLVFRKLESNRISMQIMTPGLFWSNKGKLGFV
jgi:hypothetical protein